MKYTQKAIELAILEGGYHEDTQFQFGKTWHDIIEIRLAGRKRIEFAFLRADGSLPYKTNPYTGEEMLTYWEWGDLYELILDPAFWRALGKSEGWVGVDIMSYIDVTNEKGIPEWKYHWHRLIDHLAEGGTIEGYFEQLFNK